MAEDIKTLKDALAYLGRHAEQHGGVSYATEATVNVPIRPGETLAVVRMGKHGEAEVILPIALTREAGFGAYYVGLYLLKLGAPEVTQ